MEKIKKIFFTTLFFLFQLIPFVLIGYGFNTHKSDAYYVPVTYLTIIILVLSIIIRKGFKEDFHWLADVFNLILIVMNFIVLGLILFLGCGVRYGM